MNDSPDQPRNSSDTANERERAEAKIAQRRAAVDQLYLQATQLREQVQQQVRGNNELKQRLAAREAQLRQQSLALELEREQLAAGREELQRERRAPATRPLHSDAAASRPGSAPRRSGAALALLGFTLAPGLAWWVASAPSQQAAISIKISSERDELPHVLDEYAAILTRAAPDLKNTLDPVDAAAWDDAWREGRARFSPADGVRIELTTPAADTSTRVCAAVAEAAVRLLRSIAPDALRSPARDAWRAQRNSIDASIRRMRGDLETTRARIAALPQSATWEDARDAFRESRAKLNAAEARVSDARRALLAAQARDPQLDEVSQAELRDALAGDSAFQQDLREIAVVMRDYRAALSTALESVTTRLGSFQDAVHDFTKTLAEQRELAPPRAARAVIEAAFESVERIAERFAPTDAGLRDTRARLDSLNSREQVDNLLDAQRQSADAAGAFTAAARDALDKIAAQIAGLTDKTDVQTRYIVIAGELSAAHSAVLEQLSRLERDAAHLSRSGNVRLDASDRQLRGIRARLDERQQLIRRNMKQEALAAAQGEHERTLGALREENTDAQASRDERLATMMEKLNTLRAIETSQVELREQTAAMRAYETSIARATEQLARLEQERPHPAPDRFNTTPVQSRHVGGEHRARGALLASLICGVLCAVFITVSTRARSA